MFCISVLVAFPPISSLAETSRTETWDGGTLGGWVQNTTIVTLQYISAGGNPGGYVRSSGNAAGTWDIGAAYWGSRFGGNYLADSITQVSVDLAFTSGSFDAAWVRFRRSASDNGWLFPVRMSSFSPDWQIFSATFDPAWSDAQAREKGWITDRDIYSTANASPPFAQTMSSVGEVEVRVSGSGMCTVGIDNFTLNSAVPVHAGSVDNAGGATNVTSTSATLCGNLTSTGAAPTTVGLYWGPTDGGTNPAAWSNSVNLGILSVGAFSATCSLQPNTLYYYRCWASNSLGVVWAPTTAVAVTEGPIHYVSTAGVPLWPYASWQTASTNIQKAVDAASDGDVVQVAPGVYCENNIRMKTGVNLIGSGSHVTMVDGMSPVNTAIVYAASRTLIKGFTFRRGAILPGGSTACGAIQLGSATATIAYNVFTDNDTAIRGNASGTIENNAFYGNNCGVYAIASSPTVRNNVFYNNSYGIYFNRSSAIVCNNTLVRNGQSLNIDTLSLPTVRNNIIVNGTYGVICGTPGGTVFEYNDVFSNSMNAGYIPGLGDISVDPVFVGGTGGTWTVSASCQTNMFRSTLTDKGAFWIPGELVGKCIQPVTESVLQYSIVSNDTTTLTIWGDLSATVVSGKPYRIWDYHLKSKAGHWESGLGTWTNDTLASPCIDTGHPASTWTNEPEPNGGRVNMGAYGNTMYASKSGSGSPSVRHDGGPSITLTSATLCGTLTSTGDAPTAVHMYWGPTDGGTNPAAWTNVVEIGVRPVGAFSATACGLQPDTMYYYRCSASNSFGVAWAASTTNFRTALDADGDGMDDSWETRWFGNTTTAHASSDFENDGLADVFEYQCGSNPKVADSDGDAASDGQEYVAGTDPADRLSVLEIRKTMPVGFASNAVFYDDEVREWMTQEVWSSTGGPHVLYWPTATGRTYRFYGAAAATGGWEDLTGPIPGDGTDKAYTNRDWAAGHRFYRVAAFLP